MRLILQQTVAPEQVQATSFAERIDSRFAGLSAESLPIPARQATKKPPAFDES